MSDQHLKQIPIGESEFTKLCNADYLFVDKTAKLAQLVLSGSKYFLSRPRRFGKTMLLSMLEELFTHGDQRFAGLKIYRRWPVQERCKTVRLSLQLPQCLQGPHPFESALCAQLKIAFKNAGLAYGPELQTEDVSELLALLLSPAEKNSLVLLIDESDYPLSCSIDNKARFDETAAVLNKFYSTVRSCDVYFRFIFITGIARYKNTSLFTGEDFTDLSMDPDYADLLGYTDEDIDAYFAPYLQEAAQRLHMPVDEVRAQLKAWYDGFCFDYDGSSRVYSPWSVNKFFKPVNSARKKPSFSFYWMDSSKVTHALRNFLQQHQYVSPEKIALQGVTLTAHELSDPMGQHEVQLLPLLAQSGYLSITKADLSEDNLSLRTFKCSFTNLEIKNAYSFIFLQYALNKEGSEVSAFAAAMRQALKTQDAEAVISSFNDILCAVSYQILKQADEHLYREIIKIALMTANVEVRAETPSHLGRSDLEIVCPDCILVFEFKRLPAGGTEQEGQRLLHSAVRQLQEKDYGQGLQSAGRRLMRIAAVISDETRQLEYWQQLAD